MTLNGVMAVTLRYLNKFGNLRSLSSELIDQKTASITHRTVKLVYVTRFTHSQVNTSLSVNRITLLSFNLSSKFHFTVAPMRSVATVQR